MSTVKTAHKRWKTKEIFASPSLLGSTVTVKGWVRTIRAQKTFAFVELNDGSQLSNIQIVLDSSLKGYEVLIERIQTGAAIAVTGEIVQSPGGKQSLEIKALEVEVVGEAPSDYILQKKRHSFEFLRSIAHLRPRTNTFGAVARVRSSLAVATHLFFAQKGFLYVTTPMITSSDCEGAGELFTVTSFDLDKLPKTKEGKVNFSEDFFGKEAYLIVSGQLHGETYAQSLSDIYTFGPTFRAENSNTSRHLAEFWMIEPEMAFADLNDNMTLADEYLKFLIRHLFTNNLEDLQFFDEFVEKGLINRLELVANTPCARVTYTEAITILEKSGVSFDFPVSWGIDLQSEHERFLSEKHFKSPVIVYNYPKKIKPFYMRANDDGMTVASMDLLVPVTGELIGGGQREERLPLLEEAMKKHNLNLNDYSWYLDLRRYGSTPHAGFGLGFERLIQYTTGMENIRDVIPFPRYPKHADY